MKRFVSILLVMFVLAAFSFVPVMAMGARQTDGPIAFSVDPEFLLVIAAGVLALVFDYFPGVAEWFDKQTDARKRQLNAVLVIGTLILMFAGQCAKWFDTNLICSARGGLDALYIGYLAIAVNQGTHALFKPSKALKARMFSKK